MSFRHRLAHLLLRWALHLTRPPLTIEGIAVMTILARLAALEAATAANAAALASHGDTLTGFATTDSVDALTSKVSDLASTVGGRLDAIEAEIGSEPALASAGGDTQASGMGVDALSGGEATATTLG